MPFTIPHSKPTVGEEEAEAAAAVIRSGCLVDGPWTPRFEAETARWTGARWGVASSSGTAALHMALIALRTGPGDRVALPSYVCVALLHAVRYVQAEPVIVYIDPATMNLDPDALKRVASARLKAVILPHMFGLPAEMEAITALGVPLIEDCAHAVGAWYRGFPVGGQGRLGVCSFYATKMMATGEGGMVVGSDPEMEERLREIRDYDFPEAEPVRFNYKMTEIQAAMGCVQLRRLPDFITRRRQIAERYRAAWQDLPVELPQDGPHAAHVFYRYVMRVIPHRSVTDIIERCEREGVACRRPVARPIHRFFGDVSCPGADAAFDRALSIPIYPSLSDPETEQVVQTVRKTFLSQDR